MSSNLTNETLIDEYINLLNVLEQPKKLREALSHPFNRDLLHRAIADKISLIEGGGDSLALHRRLKLLERRAEFEDKNKKKVREHLKAVQEAVDAADENRYLETT